MLEVGILVGQALGGFVGLGGPTGRLLLSRGRELFNLPPGVGSQRPRPFQISGMVARRLSAAARLFAEETNP